MAVYNVDDVGEVASLEHHLYGSSRLGIRNTSLDEKRNIWYLDKKRYELSNHLGNVLSVISDRKLGEDDATSPDGSADTYSAQVLSFNDYYPFGMLMPGRSDVFGEGYRFGFNGKEFDPEVAGNGNHYAFGGYGLDTRTGRRWNVDPVFVSGVSSYATFADNPIWFVDPSGLSPDRFFNERGELVHDDGEGDDLYVVDSEDYEKGRCENENNCEGLSDYLRAKGVRAYSSEEEAAKSWARDGYDATKNDPFHLERASTILEAKTIGSLYESKIYVLGNTVIGDKSNTTGVRGEVNPLLSQAFLNGKSLLSYTYKGLEKRQKPKYDDHKFIPFRDNNALVDYYAKVNIPY